ncbi:GNAT family N-acetyltransferase [Nocardia sp. NPDC057227]|uniref:GNAT family N-acetyltransferase n=1 Tax=Nocardia sp. NPDC057227 TaxID=3346056 RepID=UPI0036438F7B
MRDFVVERAGPDEVAEVAEAYLRAGADEAVAVWVAGPDETAVAELRRAHTPALIAAAVRDDEVWIARADDTICAVALWQHMTDGSRYRAEADELRANDPRTGPWQRLALAVDRVAAAHPRDYPHHYLHSIATVPEHRGTGAGTALLATRLHRFAATGERAFLAASTERSARLYARLGFARRGQPLPLPCGPTLIPMWRPHPAADPGSGTLG